MIRMVVRHVLAMFIYIYIYIMLFHMCGQDVYLLPMDGHIIIWCDHTYGLDDDQAQGSQPCGSLQDYEYSMCKSP